MTQRAIKGTVPRIATRRTRVRLVVNVEADLLERLRRATYWLPEVTMTGIAEAGIVRELERLERQYGALEPIPSGQRVKRGRPPVHRPVLETADALHALLSRLGDDDDAFLAVVDMVVRRLRQRAKE